MDTRANPLAAMQGKILIGEWVVEPSLNQISSGDTCVRLEPKAMQVLLCLAQEPGKVLTKEQLIRSVWPDTFVTDQVLTHAIWQLRQGFGDRSKESDFIQTIPRGGYRLVAPVRSVRSDAAWPGAVLKADWASSETSARQFFQAFASVFTDVPWYRHRRWQIAAAGVLAVAVVVAMYLWVTRSPAAVPGRVMLVVLPFENLSGDSELGHFSDGMTEEMTAQLGRLNPQRLGVIARASAMTYKGKLKRADEIGRELKVDYILEGSVRQEGRRVRITAQLISAKDQTHLWAQNYEQDRADILKLQADIAAAIAREINTATLPAGKKPAPAANP